MPGSARKSWGLQGVARILSRRGGWPDTFDAITPLIHITQSCPLDGRVFLQTEYIPLGPMASRFRAAGGLRPEPYAGLTHFAHEFRV